jgi:hypothetical protein
VKELLLDYDPLTGVREFFGIDPDGQEYIATEVDKSYTLATIERNRQIEGAGMGKDMWLAASIPIEVQFEWINKHGINMHNPNHKEGVKRLLNSGEYRYLRVNHFMI